ncbi:prolipoprotein diacylglyceryl transferase [Candidatus Peregrinibacteria bacterium]|nr:prolipoprotein diacylglyceryl transferase [Candidatus Peregrinibacteria bacterium]
MFQSPGPILVQIGPLSIHWYGAIIGGGILLCYFYVFAELKRRKIDAKYLDNLVFWTVLSGVIGARLYYVIFSWPYFGQNPSEILQIWKGGLAIHGALIGGALSVIICARRYKFSFWTYADVIAPSLLFAQALGRWGNFFNNEAFGSPTTLPWKLYIPEQFRPEQYIDVAYFHPTFLYESLWDLAGFALLIYLSRKFKKPGAVLCAYLMWYSAGRFFVEILRTDSLYFGQFKAAQIASAVLFLVGLFGLVIKKKTATQR